jgi:8-oxo-dGTP pyrophosphatase MutT (NUDIX family)
VEGAGGGPEGAGAVRRIATKRAASKVSLRTIDNGISVRYTGKKARLPECYRRKVERHWSELVEQGKKFYNGRLFSLARCTTSRSVEISLDSTDYAHFIYTIHKRSEDKNDCRVLYVSALLKTQDGYYILGIMGKETFAPGKLQLVGGGIDEECLKGRKVGLRGCIKKEIKEELGLQIEKVSVCRRFGPRYFVSGGAHGFMSIVFTGVIKHEKDVMFTLFRRHNDRLIIKGRKPEFASLKFIKADVSSAEEFFHNQKRRMDDNLIPAIRADLLADSIKR